MLEHLIGRINIADRQLIIGRGLSAVKHKAGCNNYLFYLLQQEFSVEDSIGNGSIFASVSGDELRAYKVLTAKTMAEKFNKIIQPMDEQIAVLIHQNAHLRQTRDRLLPRLISGKLSVGEVSASARYGGHA